MSDCARCSFRELLGGGGGRRVFERIGIEEIVDRGFFGYAETETMVLV